jgi:hypothetical protein
MSELLMVPLPTEKVTGRADAFAPDLMAIVPKPVPPAVAQAAAMSIGRQRMWK